MVWEVVMREFAKSMLGLSWAVYVFSAQQMGKVIPPSSEAFDTAVAEVEEVSRFIQSRLKGAMIQQFQAGDHWQRRLVDAAFSAAAPFQVLDQRPLMQSFDGRAIINAMDPSQVIKSGMDFVQQTAEAVRTRSPRTAAGAPTIN
jgi:hypothetical protein